MAIVIRRLEEHDEVENFDCGDDALKSGHVYLLAWKAQGRDVKRRPSAIEEVDLNPMVILLVEDDVHIQYFIWKLLKADGFTVLTAGNGELALEASRSHPGPIDLLLTDMEIFSGVIQDSKVHEGRHGCDIVDAAIEPGAITNARNHCTLWHGVRMAIGIHRRKRLDDFSDVHMQQVSFTHAI